MNKAVIALCCALIFFPAMVRAEPIPEYVLDHDFTNCMGGDPAQKDAERAAYCNCVRDGMRSWDLDTYGEIAMAQSKASNAQQVPAKIEELAKGCIQKVLH